MKLDYAGDARVTQLIVEPAVARVRGPKAIVERARNAGATVATEPAPQPWGYAASFVDPDGHIWTVTSAKRPD